MTPGAEKMYILFVNLITRSRRLKMSHTPVSTKKLIGQPIALGVVLLLWLGYTLLQTLFVTGYISESWSAILGFIPGSIGVVAFMAAGLTREQLFLRFAPLSRRGFLVLAGMFVFALAVVLPFGRWQGPNWMAAFVYAPASGFSQELFFRAMLLPTFLLIFKQRPRLALVMHALLFGLWHIGPLFLGAPVWAVIAVMFVPFVCGIGWGWQVRHDRTVLWAMLQHSLIWVVAGQFPMPG
jgi:membrane protease YdiL (CAAX protease family)